MKAIVVNLATGEVAKTFDSLDMANRWGYEQPFDAQTYRLIRSSRHSAKQKTDKPKPKAKQSATPKGEK